jgi:hypothetical protein
MDTLTDAGQLATIRDTIKTWLAGYGVPELARLADSISLTQAILVPVVKIQLRTRVETRSVSSKKEACQAGTAYEKRNVDVGNFPIWSYVVGEGIGKLRAGEVPPPVTQKVRYSDLITDCEACGALGSKRCSQCGGQGNCQCRACGGALEVKCSACSGAGEKKCWTCNGHGEKTCHACRSGTRHDGSRCTACHGRGFTRCNECRDGFKSCGTCARQGTIQCPSCQATGRVRCGGCQGAGKTACAPCKGSGKFVTSLYITAGQSEKLADAWVVPPEYDALVPEDVATWLRTNVATAAARELSAQQFDAAPCEAADSPLAEAANRLIAESKRNVHYKTNVDRVNAWGGSFDRVVRHWYAEHYLPW